MIAELTSMLSSERSLVRDLWERPLMSLDLDQSLGPHLFWDFQRRGSYGLGPHQQGETGIQEVSPHPQSQFSASLGLFPKGPQGMRGSHEATQRRQKPRGWLLTIRPHWAASWKGNWGQEDLGFPSGRDFSEMKGTGTLSQQDHLPGGHSNGTAHHHQAEIGWL